MTVYWSHVQWQIRLEDHQIKHILNIEISIQALNAFKLVHPLHISIILHGYYQGKVLKGIGLANVQKHKWLLSTPKYLKLYISNSFFLYKFRLYITAKIITILAFYIFCKPSVAFWSASLKLAKQPFSSF